MHTETYVYKGIEYTISVVREHEGFKGFWCCAKCNQCGMLPQDYRSVDESLQKTKLRMDAHHYTLHPECTGQDPALRHTWADRAM